MATGAVRNQFIMVKKTLTNVTVNALVGGSTPNLGGAYIDITSDVPSGYVPVVGALDSSTANAVQCIPVGASTYYNGSARTWIMRLLNHNNNAKTISGTLYIFCARVY